MKREQYRQCREDWRHYDRLIWATPSIVITISGVILGISYGYLTNGMELLIIRACLLFVLAVWISTLLIALSKHRFFQVGRTDLSQGLEADSLLERTPMRTSDLEPKGWLQRRTAYKWLFISVFLTFIVIVGAFGHTLWTIICS
jgi:hypothetical protein